MSSDGKSAESSTGKPIETAISDALKSKLNPIHMEVINESYMHNVPKGAESHFKVLVVSHQFQDLTLLKVWFFSFIFYFYYNNAL